MATSDRARAWLPVALAVAILVVGAVAAVVLVRAGDGGGEGAGAAAEVVAMQVPAGWAASADGLVVAESAADLVAARPAGPVVRATVGDPGDGFDAAVEAALADPSGDLTPPERTVVDGHDAVVISTRAGGRVRSQLVVHPPGRPAVLFTVDVPAERFDQLRDVLGSVPGVSGG